MTPELQKRLYSLLWRLGGMTASFLAVALADPEFLALAKQQSPFLYMGVVLLGLIVSEFTKWLNNQFTK